MRRCHMRGVGLVLSCGASLGAQAATPDGLFDVDWRARNRCAQALAAAAEVDVERLLAIAAGEEPGAYQGGMRPFGEAWLRPWRTVVGSGQPGWSDLLLRPPGNELVLPTYQWKEALHFRERPFLRPPENFWVPWGTRTLAVWLLGTRRLGGERSVALFGRLLSEHRDEPFALQAAFGLVQFGEAAAGVVGTALGDHASRSLVGLALQQAGDVGCERLAASLRSDARTHAMVFLPESWVRARPDVIAAMVDVFLRASRPRARYAGWHVQRLGALALDALRAGLRDDDAEVRWRAVGMLLILGREASPLVADALPLLEDPEPRVRRWALRLGSLPGLESAVAARVAAALRSQLRAGDPGLAFVAHASFGGLGAVLTDEDLRILVAAVGTGDSTIQFAALTSLDGLGRLAAVPLEDLTSKHDRWTQALALRGVAAHGLPAIEILEAAVDDLHQRVDAIAASEAIDASAAPAARWLSSANPSLRWAAARGLGGLRTTRAAFTDVRPLLDDPDVSVRTVAVEWLARLEPQDDADLQLFATAIVDDYESVRRVAAAALRQRALSAAFCREVLVPRLGGLAREKRRELLGVLSAAALGDPVVTSALCALVRAEPADSAALDALARVGSIAEARETLQAALDVTTGSNLFFAIDALFTLHERAAR